jgi:hypothetical protein
MTRRSKLRQVRRLRKFRDQMLKKETASDMEYEIMRMGVQHFQIDLHISAQVNVTLEDGQHFYVRSFWEKDALCKIGLLIYDYLIGKIYPTCIKID